MATKNSRVSDAGIGPTKMLLLNCGKFEFAEVLLDAPLHLVGPNNVGKTSLIALLQMLYIDDQRKMHFSRPMAETRKYYFPDIFSYALFECLTPTGYRVVGIRGLGPVRQYDFERFAYAGRLDAADFLDSERRTLPHEEIFAKLSVREFTKLTPAQLRAALTGVGDNRGVDLRLVPARHGGSYKRFRNVFNNILRLSHLKQDELKGLIIDIHISDFQQRTINLAELYQAPFEKVQRDAQEVRQLKLLQPDIESLLSHIEKRSQCRHDIPALWDAVGKAILASRAKLERDETELLRARDGDIALEKETAERMAELRAQSGELAEALGDIHAKLKNVERLREKFADFIPEWALRREREIRKELSSLVYRLGQLDRTPESEIQRRLKRIESEISQRETRLAGLSQAAVHWLRKNFNDSELDDIFRVLSPELLSLSMEKDVVMDDEKRVVEDLRRLIASGGGHALELKGITILLDRLSSPQLKQYVDSELIKRELDELQSERDEYRIALETSRDVKVLQKERKSLESELDGLVIKLSEYNDFVELQEQETLWQEKQASLLEQKGVLENEIAQSENERVEIVRRIERLKDELSQVELQRAELENTVKGLQKPPQQWELHTVDDLPQVLDDLVQRYHRVSSVQKTEDEYVAEILLRIESHTYGRYVAANEEATVCALREQLESIPEKENAVRELWTSIAVGIQKALSNIAHDLDVLKGVVQKLNRRIGSVSISNLHSVKILVKENPGLVRHIRGITLEQDMPLFADSNQVKRSFDDIGKLLSENSIIKLDDMFELEFEIESSNSQIHRYAHLSAIESNGTTITIKVLVNLCLLRELLKDADVRVPFYLDECSSLDYENLSAIVDAAAGMGFVAVLASPDAMDAAQRLYFIEEGGNGKVVLDSTSSLVEISREKDVTA